MEGRNQTDALQFFLAGLTDDPAVLTLTFSFFLCIYLVTVLGNLLIIMVVSLDHHLHTPMYFFLSNLSFVDICLSSTTIPKLLVNMQTWDQTISYTGCLTQVCFILEFASLENCLLAVMSYDRYVAICHPLRYTVIMNPSLCVWLIILCLVISLENSLLLGLMLLRLSFCTNMESPLIYCELAQVIKLACSDTLINNILIYLSTFIFECSNFRNNFLLCKNCLFSNENIVIERKVQSLFYLCFSSSCFVIVLWYSSGGLH